jgi:hypothetical protein
MTKTNSRKTLKSSSRKELPLNGFQLNNESISVIQGSPQKVATPSNINFNNHTLENMSQFKMNSPSPAKDGDLFYDSKKNGGE